jgi:methylmalonyl-CoA mutase
MSMPPLTLAADFGPFEPARWRELVAGVLTRSGTAFDPSRPEAALSHTNYDGIEIAPLYTSGPPAGLPGVPPYLRGARPAGEPGWDVRARYAGQSAAETNRAVLADLAHGVSSLWLCDPQPGSLAAVLDGVYLDLVWVSLDSGADTPAVAAEFLELIDQLPAGEVRGSLGADPLGHAARTGNAPDLSRLAEMVELTAGYPGLLPVTVDATGYHDAGGTDADELAIGLAVALCYLRTLTESGIGIAEAFAAMEFRLAVTDNQFESIAKLRAARRIWDRVGEACGLDVRPGQRQHAVTSAAMMTRRDPWVNLLRTTIACFAAAVGQADAITVAPFDSALGLPQDFGRRIARNTQSILHDESSLARVADAAGGSFYVESLTARLAEVAWAKFTAIEAAGGALAALAGGQLAGMLESSWQARRANLATRQDPITGVSEFALADEPVLQREGAPAAGHAAGLPRHRYAEDFERLRDLSDEVLAETGRRPRVLLAALGPAATHGARVGFASNLLQAGGIEPVIATGDAGALAAALAASGASVACLCSSDKVYAEQAAEAAQALRRAGAARIWIAGRAAPAGVEVDLAIHLGCDAVQVLQSVLATGGPGGRRDS